MNDFVYACIKMKNQMQLYHWHTKNYARHKARGEYYDKLDKNLDRFVEALQGSKQRINITKSIELKVLTEEQAFIILEQFMNYLKKSQSFMKNKPDLLTIRDEMLADTNQTLYLFTLS